MWKRDWGDTVQFMKRFGLVLAVLVLAMVLGGCGDASLAVRSPSVGLTSTSATAASASSPARTASPAATLDASTATPAATRSSLQEGIDELASALERSDWVAIRGALAPKWNPGFYSGEGTRDLNPDEAIAWLQQRAENGRLDVTVERQSAPTNDGTDRQQLSSTWRGFNAYMTTPNRTPVQKVNIYLSNEGGRWLWRTGVFGGPPI
jgi:hypothetical protein